MSHPQTSSSPPEPLKPGLAGFKQNWRFDFTSGFLVFLIALPLCLGISMASGFPPQAGIITAVVGGLICSLLSNSQLTIKGPAAGLIIIVLGAVLEFGGGPGATPENQAQAYRLALGVIVAAGILQVIFGLVRGGFLGDFFPTSVVHGMLAAIGLIIIVKQLPFLLGAQPPHGKELFEQIAGMPEAIHSAFAHGGPGPEVAIIGVASLLILFGLPLIRIKWVKMVPAPMIVLLVAVPLGLYFGLHDGYTYDFFDQHYQIKAQKYLVNLPGNLEQYLAFPDFGALATFAGWKWVLLFALIGSLESMLSAKAVDMLDPWQRKTNLNRDLIAVGIANTVCGLIGGLPMISEIVRSSANKNNGARTSMANMFHGLFLAGFVIGLPWIIKEIPLALAAMLIYTGFRLASPKEWIGVYKIGREQLVIFSVTVVTVLATDLLIGIGVGIAVKFLIHWLQSAPSPVKSLVKPDLSIEPRDAENTFLVTVRHAAVFSNWLFLKRQLLALNGSRDVVLDLSSAYLVDHTVMEHLHELEMDFARKNRRLIVTGLDSHSKLSNHPFAARKKTAG